MSDNANVKLSTLYELNSSLHTFQGNMAAIKSDIDNTIRNYFAHFQKQRQVLSDRLAKAERELESAEGFLRVLEIRMKPKFGDDDEKRHRDTLLIATAKEKVAKARKHRDLCRDLLKQCDRIISNCSYRFSFHNGTYRVIDMTLINASKGLRKHIENVQDYQNTGFGEMGGFSVDTAPSFPSKTESNQNVAKFRFHKNQEEPLRNVKITIVDNQPFGFGQIDVITDENGMINIPFCETSDCSIYIDGKEVYSGKLYKSIHYDESCNGVISLSNEE